MRAVDTGALIAFLNAQLDEDETTAKTAAFSTGDEPWIPAAPGEPDRQYVDFRAHLSRHDPARVLREVEAKRRLLAEIEHGVEYEAEPLADMTLRFLALPYSGNPGYRDEWKP